MKMLQNGSTVFLRLVVGSIAFVVLMACVFLFPRAIFSELQGDFDYAPILIGIYITAIAGLVALHQTLRLLGNIDRNEAFSVSSLSALGRIRHCAIFISGIYTLGLPYFFRLADQDDAPGVMAIGLILAGGALVVATAVAVFEKLLRSAIALKSEQDLTV